MKQQCHLAMIYLSWTVYLGGAAFLAYKGHYAFVALWLVLTPFVQIGYVKVFPSISKAMGYGSVSDTAAKSSATTPVHVTLYTAFGCPFCPIVEQRLETLQHQMEFTLRKVDVTFRPELLAAKKISAIPVVEVGEQQLVGNATSEQLAALITVEANKGKKAMAATTH